MSLQFTTEIIFPIFLLVVFAVYWSLNKFSKLQNTFLLFSSYFFYAFGNFSMIFMLIGVTLLNYYTGILIEKQNIRNSKKIVLILSHVVNFGILSVFKYSRFFYEVYCSILEFFGFNYTSIDFNLVFLLGVSFFTFSVVSYNIEIYRGKMKPIRNIIDFALFVSFFAKIAAGPIERPQHFEEQITKEKTFSFELLSKAFQLIILGYFKKIVIADRINVSIAGFYSDPSIVGSVNTYIIIILYSLAIYTDFSGYTDIARGISGIFGIELVDNFKQPYFSTNLSVFWQRWHISLSSWIRDYIYIPLGGSRKGKFRTYFNLIITMVLCGFWHGAGFTFILWGLIHGLGSCVNRIILQFKKNQKLKDTWMNQIIAWIFCFSFITFAWILFRCSDINTALYIIKNLFQFTSEPGFDLFYLKLLITYLFIILIIDIVQVKLKRDEIFDRLHWFLRAVLYFVMIFFIVRYYYEIITPFIYEVF